LDENAFKDLVTTSRGHEFTSTPTSNESGSLLYKGLNKYSKHH